MHQSQTHLMTNPYPNSLQLFSNRQSLLHLAHSELRSLICEQPVRLIHNGTNRNCIVCTVVENIIIARALQKYNSHLLTFLHTSIFHTSYKPKGWNVTQMITKIGHKMKANKNSWWSKVICSQIKPIQQRQIEYKSIILRNWQFKKNISWNMTDKWMYWGKIQSMSWKRQGQDKY